MDPNFIFFLSTVFFVLGMVYGSFLSVLIPRLKHQSPGIVFGRSFCPKCHHQLGLKDLIPLLSFLLLKGKCRYCQSKVSLSYPLLELFTGLIFLLLYLKFFAIENQIITLIIYQIYALVLIFIFFYDLWYFEINDYILIPAIISALIISFFSFPLIPRVSDALLGALIPLSFFLLQIIISKGTWIGGGDLRIGAFMGLILGWQKTAAALIISYLIGGIFSLVIILLQKAKLKSAIPFGPFLVSGTLIAILWGENLIHWYINLIMLM